MSQIGPKSNCQSVTKPGSRLERLRQARTGMSCPRLTWFPSAIILCFFIWLYSWLCSALIRVLTTFTTLSGNSLATSLFSLLSKNALSTLRNVLIMSSASSSFSSILSEGPQLAKDMLNHSSKDLKELKISGRAKLSRAHSSGRLFCRGVPVRMRR